MPKMPGVYRRCRPDCPANCRHHKWAWHAELGRDPATGERIQDAGYGFDTQDEAATARAEAIKRHRTDNEAVGDRAMTVEQYFTTWLAQKIDDGELRPTTAANWLRYTEQFIIPVIGRTKLRKTTSTDIARTIRKVPEIGKARYEARAAQWQRKRREREQTREQRMRAYAAAGHKPPGPARTQKTKSERAPRRPKTWKPTQNTVFTILSSAFTSAQRAGLIGRNPCATVEYRGQPTKRRIRLKWSLDDLRLFCKAAEELRLGSLFILAAFTGMRRGELCGLRWIDIQLKLGWTVDTERSDYDPAKDSGVLVVSEQRYVVDWKVGEGEIKTEAGEDRHIMLDATIIMLLRIVKGQQDAEREEWGPAWIDSGRVFTKETGEPWHPQYVTKTFGDLIEKLALPYATLHGLRHLSVGLGAEAGETLLETSRRLGHSSTRVTGDMYGHIFETQQQRSAAARAKLLRDAG